MVRSIYGNWEIFSLNQINLSQRSNWIISKLNLQLIKMQNFNCLQIEPYTTILYDPARKKEPSLTFQKERDSCLDYFSTWNESDQVDFVEQLLSRMCHYQHGHINSYLRPMLQRDFISLLPSKFCFGLLAVSPWFFSVVVPNEIPSSLTEKGLDHIAENILSYLDAESLKSAELVCKEWLRVIFEGMLWKKLIERKSRTDTLWRGLAERRGWIQYLFKPKPGSNHPSHAFYRSLFPKIIEVSHPCSNKKKTDTLRVKLTKFCCFHFTGHRSHRK